MAISQLYVKKRAGMEGLAGHESALLTVAEHKHGCEGQLPNKKTERQLRGREARASEGKIIWERSKKR